jgi:hypothetical protein
MEPTGPSDQEQTTVFYLSFAILLQLDIHCEDLIDPLRPDDDARMWPTRQSLGTNGIPSFRLGSFRRLTPHHLRIRSGNGFQSEINGTRYERRHSTA